MTCCKSTILRGVRRKDGARDKKQGCPVFEPDVFWKQMYYIKQSTCDIVGTRCLPAVIQRPENCAPLSPSLLHLNMGVRRGGQKGHLPPLEIGTKKQKFLENVKSAV